MMVAVKHLLSEKQAAQVLKIHPVTLGNMARTGQIKYVLIGKRRRYNPEDLYQFILEQTHGGG